MSVDKSENLDRKYILVSSKIEARGVLPPKLHAPGMIDSLRLSIVIIETGAHHRSTIKESPGDILVEGIP